MSSSPTTFNIVLAPPDFFLFKYLSVYDLPLQDGKLCEHTKYTCLFQQQDSWPYTLNKCRMEGWKGTWEKFGWGSSAH